MERGKLPEDLQLVESPAIMNAATGPAMQRLTRIDIRNWLALLVRGKRYSIMMKGSMSTSPLIRKNLIIAVRFERISPIARAPA